MNRDHRDGALALRNKVSETTDKGYRRAREILQAARGLLAGEGYAGLSMRTVASRVGASLSNVQHYYPSKDLLLEALLSAMREEYQQQIDSISKPDAGASKLQQFEAVIDYLLDETADIEGSAVLRELWALAVRNTMAAEILQKMLDAAQKTLRKQIKSLSPELAPSDCETRAVLILAHLQGLTLILANPRTSPRDSKALKAAARAAIVQLATAPVAACLYP
ncbi:MAG: TetR/AcrR family transcriptional regulator [Burkholderiaceae bacterium]|nr:TetR/AcrR family transcriptional regulator [Roseateles sp.]MBV8471238.1 TetR/AcrR family transcriptional regulator [Burkholderiaceae bacterium]